MSDPIKAGTRADGSIYYWFRLSAGWNASGRRVQVCRSFDRLKEAMQQTLHAVGVALAIAALPLVASVMVAVVVELATGRPLRRKFSGPGRRAAAWSTFYMGLGVFIIDLTLATGWSANDPAMTLAVAGLAVVILTGVSMHLAGKSRRQRAEASADWSIRSATSHGP